MTNKFQEHRLKEGLNVLSLFDGMGCVWEVLERLGIKVANAYSSEVDKFANIANHNAHPYVIPLGDVRDVKASDLPNIDFVSAGSPCQGFSFAGKQLKFDDPRSALFWEFVRILEEVKKKNPNVIFLLENVGMDKESELVISKAMGINSVFLNSALVCAQNRERNYWTNIGTIRDGFFGDVVPGIQQPKDRGIYLKDILQPIEEIAEKYYLKGSKLERMTKAIVKYKKPITEVSKLDVKGNPKPNQQKAGCLTGGGHSGGNHSDMDIIIQQGRGYNEGGEFTEKSPPITANSWEHNRTLKQKRIFGWRENENSIAAYQNDKKKSTVQEHVYIKPNGKTNALTTEHQPKAILGFENIILRRLTPIECCRLQGIRDNFFLNEDGKQVVSDSQAYKMLGNGWQCDTIEYIVKHAIE